MGKLLVRQGKRQLLPQSIALIEELNKVNTEHRSKVRLLFGQHPTRAPNFSCNLFRDQKPPHFRKLKLKTREMLFDLRIK